MTEPASFHLHHHRHISPWLQFGLPVGGLLLLWIFYREIPFLFTSLMLSWGLFYVLNPVVDFLEARSIRRGVACAITLLGLFVLAYLLWHRLVTVSADLQSRIDLKSFQKNLVTSIHGAVRWAEEKAPFIKRYVEPETEFPEKPAVPKPPPKKGESARTPAPPQALPATPLTLYERIEVYVDQTIKEKAPILALRLAKLVPELAFTGILVLYFTFFLLKDAHKFKKALIEWIPNRYFEPSLKFFYEMNRRMRSYLLSLALDCTVIGFLVGAGSAAVGAPYPVAFGVIAGILNTIPLLGPLLYGLLCLVITIGAGEPGTVIFGFLGVFLASRLCDDLLLAPMIYGKSHHLHPVLIVTAVLLGEHFAGVWGMLLAVPIVSTILLGMSIAEEIAEGEEIAPLPSSVFKPFA